MPSVPHSTRPVPAVSKAPLVSFLPVDWATFLAVSTAASSTASLATFLKTLSIPVSFKILTGAASSRAVLTVAAGIAANGWSSPVR